MLLVVQIVCLAEALYREVGEGVVGGYAFVVDEALP